MAGHNIVVIGGSAGGVPALVEVARGLPADLPAAVFVVIHVSPQSGGRLADIVGRAGSLPAQQAVQGEAVAPGRIYVAPPDHHLRLHDATMTLDRGARENRSRPAIDALFRSAAGAYGPRVVGVVLSGMLYDGALGLQAIHRAGGVTVVQDPADAAFPEMPTAATSLGRVDHVLPAAEIAPLLIRLAHEEVKAGEQGRMADDQARERINHDVAAEQKGEMLGKRSVYSCPECGGALWEVPEGDLVRFECHVGHTYSADGLLAEMGDGVEHALWSAIRVLREQATLSRSMAERLGGEGASAQRLRERAEEADRDAQELRQALERMGR